MIDTEIPPTGAAARPTLERRADRRGRVLLAGKIVYGAGFTADCTIRDLNAQGAKVKLPPDVRLPKDLHLIVVRDGSAHRAHVLWTRYPNAGLAFEESHKLTDRDLAPELRPLRALWSALAPSPYSETTPPIRPAS